MPNYPEPKFRGPKRTKAPRPLSRVELHIHLDGSLRLSTVWELSKAKVILPPSLLLPPSTFLHPHSSSLPPSTFLHPHSSSLPPSTFLLPPSSLHIPPPSFLPQSSSSLPSTSASQPDFLFPEALTSRDQGNKTVAL